MEKIKKEEVTSVEFFHEFYCDTCNKFLGMSSECDDGYYEEYGEVDEHICLFNTWYEIKGTFCESCFEKFKTNIIKRIKAIGFKGEK